MSGRGADVVVLTALPSEYVAVREQLSEPVREHVHEGVVFEVGAFQGRTDRWIVAVAQAGPGNTVVGTLADRAIRAFRPETALFVGVAGGRKDVGIGDVVASSHVYGYESGKDTAQGLLSRIKTYPADFALVQRAQTVARDDLWQQRIVGTPCASSHPVGWVAPIAAGEKVVASAESATARLLDRSCGDALAVEMEGYGFLAGTWMNTGVRAMVVRGISDLMEGKDPAADVRDQPAAARHAAAFAFEVLYRLERTKPDRGIGQLRLTDQRVPRNQAQLTIGFGADESLVVVARDATVHRWSLADGRTLTGAPASGTDLRPMHQAVACTTRAAVALGRPRQLELVHFDDARGTQRRTQVELGADEHIVQGGGRVVATHDKKYLRVRSFDDGSVLRQVPCPGDLAASAISADAGTIAMATHNRLVVHRGASEPVVKKVRNRAEWLRPGCAMAVSPDGSLVACGTLKEVVVWQPDDDSLLLQRAVSWRETFESLGAEGMRLLCTNQGALLWLRRGVLARMSEGPDAQYLERFGRYDDIVCDPDSTMLAAAATSGAVYVWDWNG